MSTVILKGFILVPESDLSAVKHELPNHIELTRNETGCLVFEVTQDNKNVNRFDVYEEFSDENAFIAHQERVQNSRWGLVAANVERHYEIEGK